MSFKALCKFTLLATHVVAGLATPLDRRAADDELVATPAGLVPKSNVHAVPAGATVQQSSAEVQIVAANGTVLHSVPFSGVKGASPLPTPPATSTTKRDLPMGYLAYAYWLNDSPNPISFFGTNWNVPPIPASWDGQLLYWFNGLEPATGDAILQPVLQYGVSPAGGGEFYSVASWWLVDNNVFHTDITQVAPGTFLQGQMTLTGTSTSGGVTTYSYESTFVGIPASTISATSTEALNWAFEALEIYTTVSLSDLPTGNTVFSKVDLTLSIGQNPPPFLGPQSVILLTELPWQSSIIRELVAHLSSRIRLMGIESEGFDLLAN
ncbi:hypothetical protein CPB84DRAFT_1746713 [Gymnopilus junonius]|uniref:Uncharacterized protein n=1 Tax=Gymnopilus junonius TaxID=109634 RepID=A0A9P5TPP2_GYMJU|nr:hypothetical protein CPB84DRAFT_1746713 [Gymnopilus junonius]